MRESASVSAKPITNSGSWLILLGVPNYYSIYIKMIEMTAEEVNCSGG